MKFTLSFIASSLLLAVASADSVYNCKIKASYNVMDVEDDPLLPTNQQKDWASARLQSTYNQAHTNDFSMNSEEFQTFTYEEARRKALRGRVESKGNIMQFLMRYYVSVVFFCRFCSEWDDDYALTTKLEEELKSSYAHTLWEAGWCDELQQGPHLVFNYAYGCAIEVYDCVEETSTSSLESNGELTDTVIIGRIEVEEIVEEIEEALEHEDVLVEHA